MQEHPMAGETTHAQFLESIRSEAIAGGYEKALTTLNQFLEENPDEIDALRLKGNILELRALDGAQYHAKKLLRLPDYVQAQECYEKILDIDARNTLALIDLGDHYKNLGAYDKAISFLARAASLLDAGEFRLGVKEEAQEILDRVLDIETDNFPSKKLSSIKGICQRLIDLGRKA
jgi:tetratricopeptide (TPR) repeat protein